MRYAQPKNLPAQPKKLCLHLPGRPQFNISVVKIATTDKITSPIKRTTLRAAIVSVPKMSKHWYCAVLLVIAMACGGIVAYPEQYVGPAIRGSSDSCPSERSIEAIRENISAELGVILRERVVPAFQCDLGTCESNPAPSCNHIYESNSSSVSGIYWLRRCDGAVVKSYCRMGNPCGCSGSNGGWKRIAFVNTTDQNQPCPAGTRLFSESFPLRTCARLTHGCLSLIYPTDFMEYSRVCGRIIGYQHRSPDAFSPYTNDRTKTIDNNYLDGISLTYGQSPRKHIWSFAVGLDETRTDSNRCPCANTGFIYDGVVPPFIGNDYFCATASRQDVGAGFYPNDPVWDGEGCGPFSTCCSFNNPPWFCKTLPSAARENVELRMCGDEDNNNENIPITLVEIYIQ